MKQLKILLFTLFMGSSSICFADAEAAAEAEKLMDVMQMEMLLQQSISQMLDLQLQQNPTLAPYKSVMVEFLNKYMSYESLKSDFVKIYAEAFTTAELKQLNAFYSSDVGKKTIKKMPELMAQGGQIGASRVQENIAELQAMIKAESERIQKLQQQ